MAQGNYGKFGILKTTVCVPVQCYVSVSWNLTRGVLTISAGCCSEEERALEGLQNGALCTGSQQAEAPGSILSSLTTSVS